MKLLGEKIVAVLPTPEDRIAKLVDALGSDDFQTRQAAGSDLAAIGSEAGPALRTAVAKSTSPEVRKLAAGLLVKIDGPPTTPEDLRALRAVEIVEGIGSPESRELLQKWATGPAAQRLTVEAKEALERLKDVRLP